MSGSDGFSACSSVAISSNWDATETDALRHQDAQQAPNCWRLAGSKSLESVAVSDSRVKAFSPLPLEVVASSRSFSGTGSRASSRSRMRHPCFRQRRP